MNIEKIKKVIAYIIAVGIVLIEGIILLYNVFNFGSLALSGASRATLVERLFNVIIMIALMFITVIIMGIIDFLYKSKQKRKSSQDKTTMKQKIDIFQIFALIGVLSLATELIIFVFILLLSYQEISASSPIFSFFGFLFTISIIFIGIGITGAALQAKQKDQKLNKVIY
ncbi:MAG: hypothetical protein ACP6IY_07430 [Promethearchaeia archaeon]